MVASIRFIGGGHMASSIIQGLIDSGYSNANISVSDPNQQKRERLEQKFSVKCYEKNLDGLDKAQVILLAVKPQDMKLVSEEIKHYLLGKNILIITIAAGITTKYLNTLLGGHLPIVRAMPNTAALLRVGATGLYANSKVSEDQKNEAESILRSIGITVWVSHEHDMDVITALSGSGPAYFFFMMDALQQGAIQLGLSPAIAKILTLQTAFGAARMALESEVSLDTLISKVASKGGTTEKALSVLESKGIREILKETLSAAKIRSEELSQDFEDQKTG